MNIYQNLYDIIHSGIFGGAELTANADLVVTCIATAGCIALISIPFVIVYKVITMIMG